MEGDDELVLSSEGGGAKERVLEAVQRNKLWVVLHFIGFILAIISLSTLSTRTLTLNVMTGADKKGTYQFETVSDVCVFGLTGEIEKGDKKNSEAHILTGFSNADATCGYLAFLSWTSFTYEFIALAAILMPACVASWESMKTENSTMSLVVTYMPKVQAVLGATMVIMWLAYALAIGDEVDTTCNATDSLFVQLETPCQEGAEESKGKTRALIGAVSTGALGVAQIVGFIYMGIWAISAGVNGYIVYKEHKEGGSGQEDYLAVNEAADDAGDYQPPE